MKIGGRIVEIDIEGAKLKLRRTDDGVVEIFGSDDLDVARGLGFAHAHDRLVQMMLVRMVGRGRLCESLGGDDSVLAIDIFMRQMGFGPSADAEVETCTPRARGLGEAYCAGVNHVLQTQSLPWEFRLANHKPEPWTLGDTLLTIQLMSYVGLAQTQQDLEKFLIQSIRSGVDVGKLKRIFSPHLDGLDRETIDLLSKVRLFNPTIPDFSKYVPALTASNNWAVGPERSASGFAIDCNDPHLEINRLPAIWYEFVAHIADDYRMGISMPGVPGFAMGRTQNLSLGFTYGFMDMVDYFIEDCRDGSYRRGDKYQPLRVREEVIRRRKGDPVRIFVYENDMGVLETDPLAGRLEDGLYLNRVYTVARHGAADSLDALAELGTASTVAEAQKVVRRVSISCNWVIADREGNIGYQQSGRGPIRSNSTGLLPLPAWKTESHWKGIVPADQLSSLRNPPEGRIVTANDNWNQSGKPQLINISMGSYRADRIRELLGDRTDLTPRDMQAMQADLYSIQARKFMDVLRPLIPESPAGEILAEWDLCYDPGSRGAVLFEKFYERAMHEVFGAGMFGADNWRRMSDTTNLFTTYFERFDRILLGKDQSWFGKEGRDGLFRRILQEATSQPAELVERWGEQRQIMLTHVMLGGVFPSLLLRTLRINRGPIPLPGCRCTIAQGGLFQSAGRTSTFAPSYRFVTDMGTDEAHTVLPGGPSGRPYSRWYVSDLARWRRFEYKTLSAQSETPSTLPFDAARTAAASAAELAD